MRDHVALRGRLARIEALARAVESGESWRVRDLRAAAEALFEALREHMGWEDRHLGPTLCAADASPVPATSCARATVVCGPSSSGRRASRAATSRRHPSTERWWNALACTCGK